MSETKNFCTSLPRPRSFGHALELVDAVMSGTPPSIVLCALEAVDTETYGYFLDRIRVCRKGDVLLEWIADADAFWASRFFVQIVKRFETTGAVPLLGRLTIHSIDCAARTLRQDVGPPILREASSCGFFLATGIAPEACGAF